METLQPGFREQLQKLMFTLLWLQECVLHGKANSKSSKAPLESLKQYHRHCRKTGKLTRKPPRLIPV